MAETNAVTGSTEKATYLSPPAIAPVAPNSASYKMTHSQRGKACIFNHENFSWPASIINWFLINIGCRNKARLPERRGTSSDVKRLNEILTTVGFDVITFNNLKEAEIKAELEKLAKENHSDRDCLMVIVLSHGSNDTISANDGDYKIEELWMNFTSDKCQSLAGKPKVFFVQACRGDDVDYGTTMLYSDETDGSPLHQPESKTSVFTIPSQADFLIAYATTPGRVSYRSPRGNSLLLTDTGSWFIQALCQVLEDHWQEKDLLWMLTEVCRLVAIKRKSDGKKQMPCIVSSLIRTVNFAPNGS